MSKNSNDIDPIILGCRKNERTAQKELYQRYYNLAMSICMRYATNRDDAVEIMNEGFFKLFRYIDSYDPDQPFKPWLSRIMVNASIDYLHRKKKFEKEEELRMAEQVTQKPSALESINYNELLELVWKLSDAYRTVFNLIAIEGYTHEEVSKLLNISVGTSKSNYARAKQRLQVMLKEYFGVKNG